MQRFRSRGVVLAIVATALIAVSCSSSSKSTTTGGTTATSAAAVKQGGSLVFGAEQEPDCMDWIGSCAGAAWGVYTVETNIMPRAYN